MKAIERQDGLAEAHALLGDAEFNTWQWQPAEKEYKRAIELAPNDHSNHLRYARFLAAMGRPAQAVDEAEKARRSRMDRHRSILLRARFTTGRDAMTKP